ncbi:c-type cytochrome [Piscinibacter sp. Jin2]|uniref:C-type cytochrome n=1 Tax=Aquariibacter lacus TaxID=2801332 RepID=A0A9X0XG70_9BURK|nr:c-type cytochrome [Piscinibacter lacus]MBL0720356.1 c-type cytochrome [Piscinibacter lacus]
MTLPLIKRLQALAATVLLGLGCSLSLATEAPPTPPAALLKDLPPLGETWRVDNPYRGDARVAAIGRSLYNESCARCHGPEGDATRYVGNDLRMLDIYCHRRIEDPAVRAHCVRDNDDFFKLSVLEGKRRAGVTHMPAWKDVLSQEAIWAIRTFLESRRPAKGDKLPSGAGG